MGNTPQKMLEYHRNIARLMWSCLTYSSIHQHHQYNSNRRIICLNANYKCHTKPLFYQLRSLNVFDIIDLNSLVFMYKAFHNSLPANLLSYFKKVNGSHNHSTRNNNLNFKVRYRRTTKKALSICVRGSKMWNSLSPDIKLSRNVNAFKKMLKSSLLENYKF